MTLNEDQLVDSLWRNRRMETPQAVADFDEAIVAIAANPSDGVLSRLLNVFDDRCEHHEVMWGLVHFVESFPIEQYVQTLVQSASQMLGSASEWTTLLFIRLLNDDYARHVLKIALHGLPSTQSNVAAQVLETIAHDDYFKEKVESVLS